MTILVILVYLCEKYCVYSARNKDCYQIKEDKNLFTNIPSGQKWIRPFPYRGVYTWYAVC